MKLDTTEYITSLRQRFGHLNESFDTLKRSDLLGTSELQKVKHYFEDEFGIDGSTALSKYTELPGQDLPLDVQKQVIEDAQDLNKDAINYLFYRAYGGLYKSYQTFLGPNGTARSRKINGQAYDGKSDFLALAYTVLCGNYNPASEDSKSALEYFNVNKLHPTSPYGGYIFNFVMQFTQLLTSAIIQYIKLENSSGMTGYGVANDLGRATQTIGFDDYEESDTDGSYYIDDISTSHYNFFKGWKEMCDDPDLYEGKNVTPADILRYVLDAAEAAEKERVSGKVGIKATTQSDMATDLNAKVYELSKCYKVIQELFEDYKLDYTEFESTITTIGPSIMRKYLKK